MKQRNRQWFWRMWPRLTVCHGFALFFFIVGVASAQSPPPATFYAARAFEMGWNPGPVAVGDFNGDGKLDVVTASGAGSFLSVALGNGDGTFQPAVQYTLPSWASSIAVGDFNGDGKLDVAVLVATSVAVLLGNGDGTFQTAVSYGGGGSSVAVGDFNGDGKLDLVVTNYNCPCVSVLLGNGNGTFQTAVNYTVGDGPYSSLP